MSRSPQPTPALVRAIVAFIRAGSFPQVAAEAAGLSVEQFDAWMEQGSRAGAPAVFRRFRTAIRKAQAEARITVEVELRKSKPLDWLRCGPGKPGDLGDGWTTPVKAGARDSTEADPLAQPQIQQLIAQLLAVLAPYPEVRQAVARALNSETMNDER